MDNPHNAKGRELRELFDAASELLAQDRAAYLDVHCPDPVIRKRLDVLLASHDSAEKFLSTPAAHFNNDGTIDFVDALVAGC